jgi:hypothetical protein
LRHATVRVNEDGFRSDPRLIESGFAPEISPDGRWIAYLEAKAEPYGPLWMTDLQQPGAKPWKVSDQFKRPSYTVFPQNFVESVHFWSSHKPRLYFRARGASGADNVWQVDPVLDGPPRPAEQVTDITDPSAEIWDFRLSGDGRRLSYLLKSKAKNVVDLYVRDLARNKESVEWSEPAGSALACPGWLADDSIVVLRVQRGDMSATDVLLVKAGKAVEVGRLRDVTQGSAALDSRQRILYLTRDVGVVHSLLALRLGAGERRGEEVLHTSEPHGAAIVGIRVLGNGQLLFALQTSNDDILSSAFVK